MLRTLSFFYLLLLTSYVLLRSSFGDSFWWLSLANTFAPILFLPLFFSLLFFIFKKGRIGLIWTVNLGLFGIFWFMPNWQASSTRSEAVYSLKVISFNMHDDPLNIADWIAKEKPDLVLLQEVPAGYAGVLEQLGNYYMTAQPSHWGNTSLSRFPILSSVDIETGDSPFQHLTIDVKGHTLSVYNVHLFNPLEKTKPYTFLGQTFRTRYDDSLRNEQIKQLAEHLATDPYPFIAGGDFNMSAYAANQKVLTQVAQDSFKETGRGWGNTWPKIDVFRKNSSLPIPPLLRLDYIWHSSKIQALSSQVGPALGSDHLPVISTLDLNPIY